MHDVQRRSFCRTLTSASPAASTKTLTNSFIKNSSTSEALDQSKPFYMKKSEKKKFSSSLLPVQRGAEALPEETKKVKIYKV